MKKSQGARLGRGSVACYFSLSELPGVLGASCCSSAVVRWDAGPLTCFPSSGSHTPERSRQNGHEMRSKSKTGEEHGARGTLQELSGVPGLCCATLVVVLRHAGLLS